jgi:DNA-binding transcriptional LysR family regulator
MLNELKVFVRTVELQSISKAARSLNLTPAVANHRIALLEQQLGARLLNRNTRSMQPTDAGQVLFNHATGILEAVERAQSDVAMASGLATGQLRVAAPLGIGRRVIAPLIAEFQALHPKLEVHLRLSDSPVDLLSEPVDVSLRIAPTPDSSFIVRKVADLKRVLCASPDYLKKHGTPQTPEDLAQHNCLLLRGGGSEDSRWTLNTPTGPQMVQVSGRFDADDGEVLTRWALLGEGIMEKSYWPLVDHFREGRLRIVLPDFPPKPSTLVMLYPHRELPTKVRIFADFIVERSRQWGYNDDYTSVDPGGFTLAPSPQS